MTEEVMAEEQRLKEQILAIYEWDVERTENELGNAKNFYEEMHYLYCELNKNEDEFSRPSEALLKMRKLVHKSRGKVEELKHSLNDYIDRRNHAKGIAKGMVYFMGHWVNKEDMEGLE